ncbi:FAD-binding oxidoreductase [bacterium]|nr:FAD-binding oxidoreductase [bacterium]
MVAEHPAPRYVVTSHETISHKSLDNLGHDWSLAADPDVAPRRPLAVFFPETTEEMARLIATHREQRIPYRIRARGHSSNGLVLGDRDTSIICTEYMNRIEPPDAESRTVWVQCGAVMAEIDAALATHGFGLPVIGDHNHITAGGFASVGGVSPASHRNGMFIDTLAGLEYVAPDGAVRSCGPGDADFDRLRGGTARHGVITRLQLRIIEIDKQRTILRNERRLTTSLERFLDWTAALVAGDRGAAMERAMWVDLPTPVGSLRVGQVSRYVATPRTCWAVAWNRVAYGALHALGYVAGRLPGWLDRLVQYAGMAGVVLSPRYASIKNVETFADRIIDSSVGDPTRMLIVFPPADQYRAVAGALEALLRRHRAQSGCLTFICMYVKGIQSPYLERACGQPGRPFSEIVLYLGVEPVAMRGALDRLVSDIDDLCIAHGAFRYMHTRTVGPDDPRRAAIDPNLALERRSP